MNHETTMGRADLESCMGWRKGSECGKPARWRFWYSTDGTCWSTAWRLCETCKDEAMAGGPKRGLLPFCNEIERAEP
jgi:hypothetical protein